MELMKGYKQTDSGVIPEDWFINSLGSLGQFNKGSGVKKDESQSGDLACIRYGELYTKHHNIINQCYSFISPEVSKNARKIKNGDILFAGSGETKEEIGKCASFIHEYDAYAGGDIIVFTPKNCSSIFLGYLLNSKIVIKQKASKGQGDAVVHISSKELSKIIIPYPPINEQTAIGQALSDADTYITSLENLIEKKKDIKKGAIQELFKPKEEWDWKSLGDIGKTFGGLSGKSKDDFKDGIIPYIPFMNIMNNPVIDPEFLDYVNIKSGESQNAALKGDLFFNGSSETPEEVGMCSVLLEEIPNLYLNSFCFGFRLKKELKINGSYLTYFFRSKEGRKLFYSMAQGATRYNLSKANFNKLIVPVPRIEEQDLIARTLYDIEADIRAHQDKLTKANLIKHGMMQNLLTGKIRLL